MKPSILTILALFIISQSIQAQDFGDAPASYGTSTASHVINANIYMGSQPPDNDPNGGFPTSNASGDNANQLNDENSIATFPALTISTTTYTISNIPVTNNTGSNARVTAWIDFDRDGIFQADEGVQSAVLPTGTNGVTSVTWNNIGGIGPNIQPGKTYARFRITTDAGVTTATPSNAASNGEVEDYALVVTITTTSCDAPARQMVALSFASPVWVSGTAPNALTATNKYRFSNVTAGVDAIVTINALVNCVITVLDDGTQGVAAGFQPNLTLSGATGHAEFNVSLVTTGSTSPVTISNLDGTSIDIDGSGSGALREFVEFTGHASYTLENPTNIVASANGNYTHLQTNTSANIAGIGLTPTSHVATASFTNINNFTLRLGAVSGGGTTRLFSLYVACLDYTNPVTVASTTLDFGDAPSSYSTLLAANGARHTVNSNIFLGVEGVDRDNDGYSDGIDNGGNATDDDGKGGNADESAVSLFASLGTLTTSYKISVLATNNTGSAANLRAWIDFDRNGTFDDDEVSSNTTVANGSNNGFFNINWLSIPAGSSAGTSYVRIRLTTQTLAATDDIGLKTDGEVEDYSLSIIAGFSLPVSFVDIRGNADASGKNIISWTMAMESNLDHYTIEASADGATFRELGKVLPNGPFVGSSSYSYTDGQPGTGVNYYRVKAVDIDAKYQYSRTVRIDPASGATGKLRLYPNPASKQVNLELTSLPAGDYSIVFFNTSGQKVHSKQLKNFRGSAVISLDISALPAGLYTVQVDGVEGRFFEKLMLK
jgi:hypothetical protein